MLIEVPVQALGQRRPGTVGRSVARPRAVRAWPAMVLAAITVAGAVLYGLLRGGRLSNLARVRFRATWLVAIAVAAQVVLALVTGRADTSVLAPALLGASQLALLAFVLANLRLPGMWLVGLGLLLNAAVITANGGMPVSRAALAAAEGIDVTEVDAIAPGKHRVLEPGDPLAWLADVLPIGLLRTVVSVGDIVLAAGTGVLVGGLMRPSAGVQGSDDAVAKAGRRDVPALRRDEGA